MKLILLSTLFYLLISNQVDAGEFGNIKVDILAKSSFSWDGSYLPSYSTGVPEITILRITIPPDTQLPIHQHPHINAGVLLRGKLTVTTENGYTLYLKAGDSIVETVNKWHYGKNENSEPAEMIVFYAGVKGGINSIVKSMENKSH
jgi:quercetin dioxygenase-like cupin family protein